MRNEIEKKTKVKHIPLKWKKGAKTSFAPFNQPTDLIRSKYKTKNNLSKKKFRYLSLKIDENFN